MKPHVIIIDEITSFAEPAQLIGLLPNIRNMRLIVVNNRENTMEIYDKSKREYSSSNQFIEAIRLNTDGVNPE